MCSSNKGATNTHKNMLNQRTTSIRNEMQQENEAFEQSINEAKKYGLKFDKENKITFQADEENDEEKNEFFIKKETPQDYSGAWVLYRNGIEEERFFSKKNAVGFIFENFFPHSRIISRNNLKSEFSFLFNK